MKNHWMFWGFWVLFNALASFLWGNIVVNSTAWALLGMSVGIGVFIVVYGAVDAYLIKQGHIQWHHALRRSVYIKAGLQLLNLFLFFGLPLSPELWAGIISVGIIDDRLGIAQGPHPLLFSLLNTLLTGALLSVMVAVLTVLIVAIRIQTNKRLASK